MSGNKIVDPSNISQEEYVKERFNSMPSAMIEYLNVKHNKDALAHLEVLFRAEYYTYRNDILTELVKKYYIQSLGLKQIISSINPDFDFEPELDVAIKDIDVDDIMVIPRDSDNG